MGGFLNMPGQGLVHATVGRRDWNVARVTFTVVPVALVAIPTLASSCCANALIRLVPRPDFLPGVCMAIPAPLSEKGRSRMETLAGTRCWSSAVMAGGRSRC